jgi:hypothetical protein
MAPTISVLVLVSLIGLILGIEKRPRAQAVRVTVKKK